MIEPQIYAKADDVIDVRKVIKTIVIKTPIGMNPKDFTIRKLEKQSGLINIFMLLFIIFVDRTEPTKPLSITKSIMELIKPEIIEELKKRREYCYSAITKFNKKLPKKFMIAYAIALLYAVIRIRIDPEENVSFYTTLFLISLFFTVMILVNHTMLLTKIKKDIKNLDAEINELEHILNNKSMMSSGT